MKTSALSKKVFQKRIPTFLGLGVLVVALIAGTLLIGKGPGVFAPRATAETTPKQIRITNITDRSFTISFLTDAETNGFVKYGSEPEKLDSQASDNRDQVSGTVGTYQLHYITVRGLSPKTQYYFLLGSEKNSFDDNGAPFSVTTATRTGAPPAARTISGSVLTPNGAPAEGSVVYVSAEGMEDMSSQVSSSGSWAVPLSDARNSLGQYAEIEDDHQITVEAQGTTPKLASTINTIVSEAHPLPAITLGSSQIAETSKGLDTSQSEGEEVESAETETATESAEESLEETASDSAEVADEGTGLGDALDATSSGETLTTEDEDTQTATDSGTTQTTEEKTVIDLEETEVEKQTATTSQPKITGKATPSTPIRITVNSETQIETELVTDENGEFELDLSQFEDELEPGEHTVTLNYEDPETGENITKTYNFTVADTSNLIAQADTEEQPYGTENPYPIDSTPTPTPTATPSATPATDSGEATRTAKVATESTLMESGSVGTTMALVFGGLFFITSGVWSFWISNQLEKNEAKA